MADIVVLGGGFGGLAAANRLRTLLPEDDTVTLVSASDAFFMGFAKLWDLGGSRPLSGGTRPLRGLEDRGIRFVHAGVVAIDAERRSVDTTDETLAADGLVVALGALDAPGHVEMLSAAGAHDLYDHGALPAMRAALDRVERGRVVVSVLGAPYKCPPAPYEAAFVVHEALRARGSAAEVVVTTPQPMSLPSAGPDASRFVADQLAEAGVEVRTGAKVVGLDGAGRTVSLEDGEGNREEFGYELMLGVPAVAPPTVLGDGNPLAGPSGFVHPDPRTLRTAFERVYAVGDCTVVPTPAGQLPKAGVFAASQGEVAAANLAADLGHGDGAAFDGHGYCFLELPGPRVAFVEGDFLADPPDVRLTEPTAEAFARKQAFESERLAAWLG